VIDHLSILAPGLLGASVAKAARARAAARRITLWARRPETRDELRGQPFADAIAETPDGAVRDASLVILAAPVEKIIELAAQIAPALPAGCIVTDVGSVKTRICETCAAAMPPRATFIGSHPMAGSAQTGWRHADADLFVNRTVFITPLGGIADCGLPIADCQTTQTVQTAPPPAPPLASANPQSAIHNPQSTAAAPALQQLTHFWRQLGARTLTLAPAEHDEIVAHISHLPQALATTLAAFLARKNPAWRACAGNGLRDTTRIAASDAAMWIEIFQQNRAPSLRALDAFSADLATLRAALDRSDWPALQTRLETGKQFRDTL
jgi:cyclohexadieny/prephenate dehydrogenase